MKTIRNKFKPNIKELGIEKFTEVLFKLCNRTLDLEIPQELDINKEDNEEEYINEFIEYLLNSKYKKGINKRSK